MTVDLDEHVESAEADDEVAAESAVVQDYSRTSWSQRIGLALAGLAMILAGVAGYLKWQDDSARLAQTASADAIRAATDGTIALLSYHPESVDGELKAAADRLTGSFRGEYTRLVDTVVIPGAKQKHISAVATVPAAASVSATENHAVVLVFVNQTTTVGNDTPTGSTSSVRVTLDKVHDRWLISQFDPV
jgi:Mce-associated membrane protein